MTWLFRSADPGDHPGTGVLNQRNFERAVGTTVRLQVDQDALRLGPRLNAEVLGKIWAQDEGVFRLAGTGETV